MSAKSGQSGTGAIRIAVNLGLLLAIALVGQRILRPAIRRSNLRSEVTIVSAEAKALYRAFELYHDRNGSYPNAHVEPAFRPDNLDPLRRRGYYKGHVENLLLHQTIDAYDSPDDRGRNNEFWVEMTLARSPDVRFLIANSDDAPLGGGKYLAGAYILLDGTLKRL